MRVGEPVVVLTKTRSGGVAVTVFDADGRKSQVTDPDGNITGYAYDNLGRQTVTTRADGSKVTNGYDPAGQLVSYTDAVSKVAGYGYDSAGRVRTRTDPDRRTTTFGYDASGNQTKLTDAAGRVTASGYDAANRLVAVSYSDGVTANVTYTFDAAGRRISMRDGTGATTYGYDSFGRPTTVTNGAGQVVGYGYTSLGQIGSLTYPDGRQISRGYDADGQLTSITDWSNRTISFGYDADHNLRATTDPNGVVETVGVDAGDEPTSIGVTGPSGPLASFGYTYTPSGLVSGTTDSLDSAANRSLGYNALHQLTGLGTQSSAYGFDAAGNLTGLPNGSTLAYDPAGQLQTLTPTSGPATSFGFDQVGDRTSGNGATYAYNQASQLTSGTGTSGAAGYGYDGDGLRATTTNATGTREFAWDTLTASLPLLLTDGGNDYMYGPNDKVVEQSPVASDAPTYLAQDRIGSTRLITDQSGAVTGTTSYDPYGNVTAHTGTATSAFGYDGEYTDPTGLIYLRARYYDPTTGQFLTIDAAVGLTRSPYGYAGGNPINNVDPTGLMRVADSSDGSTPAEAEATTAAFDEPRQAEVEAEPTPYNGSSGSSSASGARTSIPQAMPHPVSGREGAYPGGKFVRTLLHPFTSGTVGFCVGADAAGGPGGTISGCVTLSHLTHPGATFSLGGGGGSPGASIHAGLLYSNAHSPSELGKTFGYGGSSIVIGPDIGLTAGGTGFAGLGDRNRAIYGGTAELGVGADLPFPWEFHGGASWTWTVGR